MGQNGFDARGPHMTKGNHERMRRDCLFLCAVAYPRHSQSLTTSLLPSAESGMMKSVKQSAARAVP